jgi:hypothetical protein
MRYFARMTTQLSDLPLKTLVTMLRATERTVGPDAASTRVLRRTVVAKRQYARQKRKKGL